MKLFTPEKIFFPCSLILILSITFFCGCSGNKSDKLFTRLSASESGIRFSNDIHESDSTHSFINEFGYMGGGVGIGDFNNDGLKDVYFTGNQVSSALYLNKGNNRFEDITGKAGVSTSLWATGASIIDVNADGYDDIYVCSYGKDLLHRSKNLLFINQHDLTFKEQAEEYGLADTSYSSQAAFFDYDNDGDLDMYLANYMLNGPNANSIFPKDNSGRSPANDRLYRNNGDSLKMGHPVFSDVSLSAGIQEDGFGLGVVVSDFNNDSWADIYVANDFLSNDELWLNNKNGTFSNCIARAIKHQSYSSMGADAADINNDLLPDISTLDMLPEFNERKKISSSFMNYDRYESERSLGYEPEFVRNMLQVNNGVNPIDTGNIPFFSEIGQMAGIAATDWSWSVLMADFDNDGWKDVHITNGVGRDFINADFMEYSNTVLGNAGDIAEQRRLVKDKLISLKHINLPNYYYENNRDYTFKDASTQAGIDEPALSNGAAYADFDNDGDLDLVTNNINSEAFVFINNTYSADAGPKEKKSHYLAVNLTGDSLNLAAIGAKVYVYHKDGSQMQEQNPVRGYYSTVDRKLIFGLGANTYADSLVVEWPRGKRTVLQQVKADSAYDISAKSAGRNIALPVGKKNRLFEVANAETGILFRHTDNPYNEFNIQRLAIQKYSQLGPFITTGDVNNDGLMDFFIGGAFNFSGQLFMQEPGGTFKGRNLTDSTKLQEDMDCLLFDADGDKDLDLLVTSGDFRYDEGSEYYRPRLYLNDGKGAFTLNTSAFPKDVSTVASCVTAADYDGDGDQDLFIGGRVSHTYPLPAKSYVLENQNGVFADITAKMNPALQTPGLVTSAAWTDFDSDGLTDLMLAGDWMPVRFFKNSRSKLEEVTGNTGLTQMNGMWRSLAVDDIDGDGDMDIIAGNLGANCIYRVDSTNPMELKITDVDGNGSLDPVLFYYIKNEKGERKLAPAISRAQFAEQVPLIKKKFLYYKDYATATFDDIYNDKAREKMLTYRCDETRSCFFENTGRGKFVKHVLPAEAQFAPVNAIVCTDINGDGIKDLVLAGNEYQADVITGRYDASYGCVLLGNKNKTFTSVPPAKSGLVLQGDIKDLALLRGAKNNFLLGAANNDSLRVFKMIR